MEKPFHRDGREEIEDAVHRFVRYHDILHDAVSEGQKRGTGSSFPRPSFLSVDRGTFSGPILTKKLQRLLGDKRTRSAMAYGPEVGDETLRGGIAELENALHGTQYDASHVAMMDGAWDALVCSINTIMRKPRGVTDQKSPILVIGPTLYQMFWNASYQEGMNVIAHNYTKQGAPHVPHMENVEDMFREKPRIIVITNPNNPDGAFIDNAVLKATIERAANEQCYVIIDEIQNCCADQGKELRYGSWVQAPHVIRVDGPAKRHSLAEYRQGWVIADPQLLGNRLEGITAWMSARMGNAPRAANTLLQYLVDERIRTLRDGTRTALDRTERSVSRQRDHFLEVAARTEGIREVCRRDACINFSVRTDFSGTDMELAERLIRQQRTMIMPASGYGYRPEDAVLRFTFAAEDEAKGVRKIDAGLASLGKALTRDSASL